MKQIKKLLPLILLATTLSACKSQEITIQKLPKESHKIYTEIETITKEKQSAPWPAPDHWQKTTPPQFVKLSYKIPSKTNAEPTTFTVSFLPGKTGSLLANVNRWRNQIGLSPLTEKGLKPRIKKHKAFTLVDLAYSPNSNSPNAQKRTLAAITKTPKGSWFFKMTGNRNTIEKETQNFLEYLENVTL